MRAFYLNRKEDVSGVSGVGRVAEGVEFPDGNCVMIWNTAITSIAFYKSISDLEYIHSHDGRTEVVFYDF